MVKATDCVIDVKFAILIRDKFPSPPRGDLGFRCRECGQPVKPHHAGINEAHFEHIDANPECTLSPGWT